MAGKLRKSPWESDLGKITFPLRPPWLHLSQKGSSPLPSTWVPTGGAGTVRMAPRDINSGHTTAELLPSKLSENRARGQRLLRCLDNAPQGWREAARRREVARNYVCLE